MKKSVIFIILLSCFVFNIFAQENELKLIDKKSSLNILQQTRPENKSFYNEPAQLKKRKTVNSYFGAGYSFIIFTNSDMNSLYPLLDTRNGTFLTDINLFFGFAIAQAVALEFEPSFLFTSSSKTISVNTGIPHNQLNDTFANCSNIGLFAIPITANVRFFPFFKLTTFARLFFVGGGGGVAWIKEDYDILYSDQPQTSYYYYGGISESTSQWAPLFRVMTGFTGTGGQFGFGGEIRYNIVPLKEEAHSPFVTRQASNFNSVDINLRFYFSL